VEQFELKVLRERLGADKRSSQCCFKSKLTRQMHNGAVLWTSSMGNWTHIPSLPPTAKASLWIQSQLDLSGHGYLFCLPLDKRAMVGPRGLSPK